MNVVVFFEFNMSEPRCRMGGWAQLILHESKKAALAAFDGYTQYTCAAITSRIFYGTYQHDQLCQESFVYRCRMGEILMKPQF